MCSATPLGYYMFSRQRECFRPWQSSNVCENGYCIIELSKKCLTKPNASLSIYVRTKDVYKVLTDRLTREIWTQTTTTQEFGLVNARYKISLSIFPCKIHSVARKIWCSTRVCQDRPSPYGPAFPCFQPASTRKRLPRHSHRREVKSRQQDLCEHVIPRY